MAIGHGRGKGRGQSDSGHRGDGRGDGDTGLSVQPYHAQGSDRAAPVRLDEIIDAACPPMRNDGRGSAPQYAYGDQEQGLPGDGGGLRPRRQRNRGNSQAIQKSGLPDIGQTGHAEQPVLADGYRRPPLEAIDDIAELRLRDGNAVFVDTLSEKLEEGVNLTLDEFTKIMRIPIVPNIIKKDDGTEVPLYDKQDLGIMKIKATVGQALLSAQTKVDENRLRKKQDDNLERFFTEIFEYRKKQAGILPPA